MPKKTPITEEHIELGLVNTKNEILEHADKRYAPMIVKSIVYGILASFAGGVVLGLGGLVTSTFLNSFSTKAYEQPQN